MNRPIKNKEYFFISTYGYGMHVGGAILYEGRLNEVDKVRRKEGNFFDTEQEAKELLRKIKKLLKK